MMNTMMIEDFEARAMAYGGTIDAWPAEDRAAAHALLAESTAAQGIIDEARALDAALDLWEQPQASEALLSRVLADAGTVAGEAHVAAPVATPAAAPKRGWAARLFGDAALIRPGLALAACLALGFVMGTTLEEDILTSAPLQTVEIEAEDASVIDFAFAMEDDAALLLGDGALL